MHPAEPMNPAGPAAPLNRAARRALAKTSPLNREYRRYSRALGGGDRRVYLRLFEDALKAKR